MSKVIWNQYKGSSSFFIRQGLRRDCVAISADSAFGGKWGEVRLDPLSRIGTYEGLLEI
jgi:hypothetical protein